MGPYNKPSIEILGDLINRDNPALKTSLTVDNVMLLKGPTVTTVNGRNTRVTLNGITGSGIVGKKEFFYDRMDIGQLFNGITVVFDAKGDAATVKDLLPALNAQYGVGLADADIANPNVALGNGYTPTPVTITISAACVAYTGKLDVAWTRTPVGVFPDSGPGSKVMLVGNLEDGGYFGRVSANEMLSSAELFNQILNVDNTDGSYPQPSEDMYWVKFAYKGKYLFFPSSVIAQTTWAGLYARGAVYGDETTGTFPPKDAPLRTQDAVVVFETASDTFGFRPRLATFADEDPAPAARSKDSEMGRLIWRTFKSSYSSGDWDELPTGTTTGQFDITTYFFWQNVRDSDVESVWVSGAGTSATSSVAKTRSSGWRPFLELIDLANVLFSITDVKSEVTGRVRAPVMQIDHARDEKMLVRVEDISFANSLGFERVRNYTVVSEPLLAANKIHATTDEIKINFVTEVTYSKKTRLESTNGELDGF